VGDLSIDGLCFIFEIEDLDDILELINKIKIAHLYQKVIYPRI
jgi:tRNA1(Val) A37 N6-methylase TrmN6